jgi:rod shape-determining protein MreC
MFEQLSRKKSITIGGLLLLFTLGMLVSGKRQETAVARSLGVVAAPALTVVDAIAHSVGSVVDNYILLVGAREESATLRSEVQTLRRELLQVREFEYENQRLKELLAFKEATEFSLLPARVVGRSASAWYRTLVLNKGQDDGVTADSPVVSAAGVVGRVIETTGSTSRVELITDASSAVDALVQRTRAQLVVEGDMGPQPRLLYLARGVEASVGDKVITSGLGDIYPKGQLLGEIVELTAEPGEMFQTARLSPSADFTRIEEVFVIISLDTIGGTAASKESEETSR